MTTNPSLSMNALVSPAKCAESAVDELFSLLNHISDRSIRAEAIRLVRQLALDQFEQCAQIAENWVVTEDVNEEKDGMEVGDAVAEAIRTLADSHASRVTVIAFVTDGGVVERQTQRP